MGKKQVYLIRCDGKFKIGLSQHPEKRVEQIQTSCPYKVELVYQEETEEASAIENALHYKFNHKRLRGEWFDLTEDEVNCIKDMNLMDLLDNKTSLEKQKRESFADSIKEEVWRRIETLERIREIKELTTYEIAENIGVTTEDYYSWIYERKLPDWDAIDKIDSYLY